MVRRPAACIGLSPLGAVPAHAAQQSVGRLRTALRQGGIAGLARVPPIAHRRGHISRSRRHRPLGEEGIEGRSVHRPTGGASSPLGERQILRRRRHIAHRLVHISRSRRHRPFGEERIEGRSRGHRPTGGTSSPLGERHILRRRQHIAHRRVHILRSRGRGPFGKERIEERRGRGQVGERHRPLSTRHRPTREVGYPTRGAGRPLGEGRISRRRGRLDQFAVCVERK